MDRWMCTMGPTRPLHPSHTGNSVDCIPAKQTNDITFYLASSLTPRPFCRREPRHEDPAGRPLLRPRRRPNPRPRQVRPVQAEAVQYKALPRSPAALTAPSVASYSEQAWALTNRFLATWRTYQVLHCTALPCTALHSTSLHCTALHCTALRCFPQEKEALRRYIRFQTRYFQASDDLLLQH
jgi:hypothetical protein